MDIGIRAVEDVAVVALGGKLEASVANRTRDRLRKLIEEGQTQVVIDLSGVAFIDSSGLSVLVSSFKTARQADGQVVLADLQPTVRSIIELTRLHHVFDIFDDVDSAVASCTG